MPQPSILVLNCGSSSVKFSVITPDNGETRLSGLAERLTTDQAVITFKYQQQKTQFALSAPFDHQQAIEQIVAFIEQQQLMEQIIAVGHRVVHGGEHYSKPTLINSDVLTVLQDLCKLAPLHNPANIVGINCAQQAFPNLPQVAIFDTAFHQTMPEKSYLYALPYELYQQHAIRKYGFHGTSHYFVAKQVAQQLNKPLNQCNFITAHLGNGCSVTAINKGESIDSSMGFTPLEGVMMGTRSGSIDPGIIFHLIEQLGYSVEQVNAMLNKQSGLLGLSQLSNDCRTLEQAMTENHQAKLALEIFSYQIAKQILALSASLMRLDAIIFTGGIGENSVFIRQQICQHLSLLNVHLDPAKNNAVKAGSIAQPSSIDCWVMPTNEEWVIAQQSYQLTQSNA